MMVPYVNDVIQLQIDKYISCDKVYATKRVEVENHDNNHYPSRGFSKPC